MSDNPETVVPASEVKTTLSRSEQRKKNRKEGRTQKKNEGSSGAASESLFTRIINFFVEAKEELGKVVWPTRKETVDSTWRLLVLVILAGIFLGLVDSILSTILSWIV